MNVLELTQNFCRENNLNAPSTLVSLTDPADLQVLTTLYSVSRDLRSRLCWPQQKKTYSFDLTAGRTKYPHPEDFYSPCFGSQFDRDRQERLNGPQTDLQWNERLYGFASGQADIAFRIFGPDSNPNTGGGQFQVDPSPAGGETIGFDYISKNLFIPKNWTPSTAYTSGTYVNSSGNIYLCDTNGNSSTTPVSATTANITDGTTQWDYVSAAYETVLADTDLSLWDDEIMILGLKSKWFGSKGLDDAGATITYERKIAQARGRMEGAYIGSLNGGRNNSRRYGPSTAGGWSL